MFLHTETWRWAAQSPSGEQSVHCRSQISDQAQEMDGTECLRSNLLAKIKRECNKQQQVEADNPYSHPERPVGTCKGNQDLNNVVRQVFIKHQDNNVQDHKSQAQK